MGLFGKKKGDTPRPPIPPGQVLSPHWAMNPAGKFFRFNDLDPEEQGLGGKGGIYVLWHAGVRPGWVYLGKSEDLATALHTLAKNRSVMKHDSSGGLFVTWTFIKEEFRDGVLLFLNIKLDPIVENPDVPSETDEESGLVPIPTVPPGTKINIPEEDGADDF